jgi:hypothetical protein
MKNIIVLVRGDPIVHLTELVYREWLVESEPSEGTGNVVSGDELIALLRALRSQYGTEFKVERY